MNRRRVLIETLWNVKIRGGTDEEDDDTVLIETLWNVKGSAECKYRRYIIVLIETLWNVKAHKRRKRILRKNRINRNIVECKDRRNCCRRNPS